jgi:RimJ/RimL family protein N-acetyltransferase
LFASADLALGAGGVTAWERCCLGLPSILVSIADNQRDTISLIVRSGAAIDAGAVDTSLRSRLVAALRELLGDARRREAMSQAGATLVDGRGGERVMLAAIRPVITNSGQIVTLRLAETDDEDWFLELQRQPETRRFANRPSIPSPEEHHRWFAWTLADADRMLAIVECDGVPGGMLRLDRSTAADRVNIAVMPAFHRRGIGAAVLELAARLVPGRCLEAEILPENDASLALFARAGYRQVGKTLFKRVP